MRYKCILIPAILHIKKEEKKLKINENCTNWTYLSLCRLLQLFAIKQD